MMGLGSRSGVRIPAFQQWTRGLHPEASLLPGRVYQEACEPGHQHVRFCVSRRSRAAQICACVVVHHGSQCLGLGRAQGWRVTRAVIRATKRRQRRSRGRGPRPWHVWRTTWRRRRERSRQRLLYGARRRQGSRWRRQQQRQRARQGSFQIQGTLTWPRKVVRSAVVRGEYCLVSHQQDQARSLNTVEAFRSTSIGICSLQMTDNKRDRINVQSTDKGRICFAMDEANSQRGHHIACVKQSPAWPLLTLRAHAVVRFGKPT